MITVQIIWYWNDYHKKKVHRQLQNLQRLADYKRRKQNQVFHFALDMAECISKFAGISIPGHIFRKAARKIHEAGGCDARNDYSRGYDDAITIALEILLEETGYSMEDILDYEIREGSRK